MKNVIQSRCVNNFSVFEENIYKHSYYNIYVT